MEEANKKFEELLVRQEAQQVEKTLGGVTNAGEPQSVELTKEEKSIESARKMLAGTGYDDLLFPVKKDEDK